MHKENRLKIVGEPYLKQYGKFRQSFVRCKCSCGNEIEVILSNLKRNHTKSCGCLQKEIITRIGKNNATHGLGKHLLYRVWYNIIDRCYNSENTEYRNYGERDIKVYNIWLNDFMSFYNWALSHGWTKGLTLERINNNGDYCPDNCIFVTRKIQNNNKRTNINIIAFNETKTLKQWSEDSRCQVKYITLLTRICKLNWEPELAIMMPPQVHKNV